MTVVAPAIDPAVAAKLTELEQSDPVLRDERNHTPAQLEARRGALLRAAVAAVELDRTSAAAIVRSAVAAEIAQFIESMRAKHAPDLAEIEQRRAAAMARKGQALEEIARLKNECVELDRVAAECAEHRNESARLLAADLPVHNWSQAAIGDWDQSIAVLEATCQALGLRFDVAGAAYVEYMDRNYNRRKNFRAAIVRPPVLERATFREPRARR